MERVKNTEEITKLTQQDDTSDVNENHTPSVLLHSEMYDSVRSFSEEGRKVYYNVGLGPAEENGPYEIRLPSSSERDKKYELCVIDNRNGAIVKIVEKVVDFQLSDDIVLQIKAKKLD